MTTATTSATTAGPHPVLAGDPLPAGRPRVTRRDAPGVSGIVVGVDGSDSSIGALQWALEEGAIRGAAVNVVYAWQFAPVSGFPVTPMSGAADAATAARSALARIMAAVDDLLVGRSEAAGVTSQAIEGRPSATLIEEAAHAQLLVVGTRGRGGFAGLLLGSVSQQCAAHAFCPVVVVHDTLAD